MLGRIFGGTKIGKDELDRYIKQLLASAGCPPSDTLCLPRKVVLKLCKAVKYVWPPEFDMCSDDTYWQYARVGN